MKKAEQEKKLLALQAEPKEAREKMKQLVTHETGIPSSARLDQQGVSVDD